MTRGPNPGERTTSFSTAIILMVLNGRLSHNTGFLILIVTTLLTFILSGIGSYSIESVHTYERPALPIPQVIGFLVLLLPRKCNRNEKFRCSQSGIRVNNTVQD